MDQLKSWLRDELTPTQKKHYSIDCVGEAFYSLRDIFKVECNLCGETLHEGTTDPSACFERHELVCIKSAVVDNESPTANMYGCEPCPKCNSKFRVPYDLQQIGVFVDEEEEE